MLDKELSGLREDYKKATLEKEDVGSDPLLFFRKWLDQALEAKLPEPNAMTLATVGADGVPHARMVLLKGLEEGRFVFYTNYESHKAAEISGSGKAALVFFWAELERQVRVKGPVAKVSGKTSDEYFAVRPRSSQLGAWASPQSTEVADRQELENRYNTIEKRFEDVKEIPRPEHWGGYGVVPELIEFWQGRSSRMHDRIVFRKAGDSWDIVRLAP